MHRTRTSTANTSTARTQPVRTRLTQAALLGVLGAALLSGCTTPATPAAPAPQDSGLTVTEQGKRKPAPTTPTFVENFDSLDTSRWAVSNWNGFWQQSGLQGRFTPENAFVDGQGHLVLALDVEPCDSGLCAQAAELQSQQRLGFGRYSIRMRAASDSGSASKAGQPAPGNISAAFSYFQDSTTEIDVEIEGQRTGYINAAVWKGLDSKSAALLPNPAGTSLAQDFHTYTYEWRTDRLTYFIDGTKVWETTQNVPQEAAHLMLNVWPTVNPNWGGVAQAGTVYMLVDSVTYEPL